MGRSIKFHLKKAAVAVAFVALSGTAAAQNVVWDGSLPVAGNPLTSQQYQDFTIYSLNYLSNAATTSTSTTSPFYGLLSSPTYNVASGVGQLQDYVVIATGNTGNSASNLDTCGGDKDASGCDNAYPYPQPKATYFDSMTTKEPSVVVPGEPIISTWTATADALRTFLAGNDLVFMFNLNEENNGDANTLAGQALLVSMRVQLTDEDGKVLYTYYVGANSAIPTSILDAYSGYTTAGEAWLDDGAPDPALGGTTVFDTKTLDPDSVNGWISTDPRWAYVHGAISVDATTGVFLAMGDCNYTGLENCKTINQNLGADKVAFAAFNQELSDLISNIDSGIAFMNVDVLTSGQGNGFEQLFVIAEYTPPELPEPGSLALAGLGLLGLGLIRRRRQSRTQA